MKKLVMSLAAALMLCVIGTVSGAETKQDELSKMKQKLEKTIIPSINIESAKVKTAVLFIRKLSKHPDGVEVNIIVKGSKAANKVVNLSVVKKSLYETISILCKNAGLKFHIEKNAVVITE